MLVVVIEKLPKKPKLRSKWKTFLNSVLISHSCTDLAR